MNYTAIIQTPYTQHLEACFQQEINKQQRSSFQLKKKKDLLEFHIQAKDAVALKATLHSLTHLLQVFEKVQKV